jgi:hypothetical protein
MTHRESKVPGRPSTEGCTELSCMYHGAINQMKRDGLLRETWEPDDPGADDELDKAAALRDGAYL